MNGDKANEDRPPFDAEWEIRKWNRRLDDLLIEIDELKTKHRSLIGRITRLQGIVKREYFGEEDDQEEEEQPTAFGSAAGYRQYVLSRYRDFVRGQNL